MTNFVHPRVLIGPIVLLVLWAVLAYVPARAEVADATERAETARNERVVAAGDLREAQAFVADRSSLEGKFAELGLALPAQPELGTFTRAVEQMARSTSVSVEVISPTAGVVNEDFDVPAGLASISVSIAAVGDYRSLVDFIEQLEQGERLVLIDAISMTTDASDPSLVNSDLSVRIFADSPESEADWDLDDEEFFDE